MVMKPPRGGPSTGAARPGQVMVAMALMRFCFSVERSTVSRPTGTIIAPPHPCRMRASTNSGKVVQSAQSAEARVNRMIAPANTRRAPNRSATQPLAGISTARVSR